MASDQFIRLGSIVLDRARNQPLRVVGKRHQTAGEHDYIDVEDPMLRQFGVSEHDAVYECVFLPFESDDKVTTPRNTYDYAESQLVRYPCEAALPADARRVHTQILVGFLANVLLAADENEIPTGDIGKVVAQMGTRLNCELPPQKLLLEADELATAIGGDA